MMLLRFHRDFGTERALSFSTHLKKISSVPKKPRPNTDVQDENMGEKGRGCEGWQLACSKISGEM